MNKIEMLKHGFTVLLYASALLVILYALFKDKK